MPPLSCPAKAGHPVTSAIGGLTARPEGTGSSAVADDDTGAFGHAAAHLPLRAEPERLPASWHALSALIDFDMARATGGGFLLRIEDIDAARCRPEFEAAIYEDLAWLGVAWDEPGRRQSEHLDAYARALARLDAFGLIYPSFESRAEIARLVEEREVNAPWPRDPDGAPLYPGTAKQLGATERARRRAEGP